MQVSYLFQNQEEEKCDTLSKENLISTSFPMYVFNTQVARESGVTQDDIYTPQPHQNWFRCSCVVRLLPSLLLVIRSISYSVNIMISNI